MEGLNHVCMNNEQLCNTNILLNRSVCICKVTIFNGRKQNLKVKIYVRFRLIVHISTLKVLYCKRDIGVRDAFHLSIFNSLNVVG